MKKYALRSKPRGSIQGDNGEGECYIEILEKRV